MPDGQDQLMGLPWRRGIVTFLTNPGIERPIDGLSAPLDIPFCKIPDDLAGPPHGNMGPELLDINDVAQLPATWARRQAFDILSVDWGLPT